MLTLIGAISAIDFIANLFNSKLLEVFLDMTGEVDSPRKHPALCSVQLGCFALGISDTVDACSAARPSVDGIDAKHRISGSYVVGYSFSKF